MIRELMYRHVYAYVVMGILHVLFVISTVWQGIYATKCLLMPILIAWVLMDKKQLPLYARYGLIISLLFSLIGDIVLMVAKPTDSLLFLVGLSAFLCTHIGYIIIFITDIYAARRPLVIGHNLLLVLPFMVYAMLLLYFVGDSLTEKGLLLPVAFYAMVICAMSLSALYRMQVVATRSGQWVFIGSLLFMLSDSLIAVTRFYQTFSFDRVAIMTTYILAQGLIIGGYLSRNERKSPL